MRRAFTKMRVAYLLIALCCATTIYFYPFISSSITWMLHPHFRYENRTEVKLPLRWISGEGGGLALKKPAAAITSTGFLDTSLDISDNGPNFKPTAEGRARVSQIFRFAETKGTPDELTYPFTSAGLLCSPINKKITKPSDVLLIFCNSSDIHYSLIYIGREKDIREASEIAKQVIR
jgi:hypothetical protein